MARRSPGTRLNTRAARARKELRDAIVEEQRLRSEVARYEEMSVNAPNVWRWFEQHRDAANRETDVLNQRLTSLGLEPMSPAPSLADKQQKLQQLERTNAAAIAACEEARARSRRKRGGTSSASVGPRHHTKEDR